MNARDIIRLAAKLYIHDELKKKITILTDVKKGADIKVDVYATQKQLSRIIETGKIRQKLLEKRFEILKIDTIIQLTAISTALKPSEMSVSDFVKKINENIQDVMQEEKFLKQSAKITQELKDLEQELDKLERQKDEKY